MKNLTLYVFNSCPFCTRVRALIGLKKVSVNIQPIVAGQFPSNLKQQLNQATVPVLEIDKGEKHIQDSTAIVEYLDKLDTTLFSEHKISAELTDWLNNNRSLLNQLYYPRMPKLDLPELDDEKAKQYFISSRESILGKTLSEALNDTEQLLQQVTAKLKQLQQILKLDQFSIDTLTLDQLVAFSELHMLTSVGLKQLPIEIQNFIHQMSIATGIRAYAEISGGQK